MIAAPTHVLHVVGSLGAGGMEMAMARVIGALGRRGMRHSVAALREGPPPEIDLPDGVGVHRLQSRPNELSLPWRLARLIDAIRPDVIHARNWSAWPDSAVARLLSRARRPLIFSFHGVNRPGPLPARQRLAFRVLGRMTSRVFTVCPAARQVLMDTGLPGERIEVIPNGVDATRFCPRCAAPPRAGPLIVGTAGRLSPVKNQPLLLHAAAALVQQGLDIQVRLAGTGALADALRGLSRQLGLDGRVVFAGHVQDMPGFLQDLDVFVLSSDSEAHPNALLEAMSCGLACVSTRVGGAEEILANGRCGMVVEPARPQLLAEAISVLARDEPRRRHLGQAARRQICRHYSMEQMERQYAELYEQTARARPGGRRK